MLGILHISSCRSSLREVHSDVGRNAAPEGGGLPAQLLLHQQVAVAGHTTVMKVGGGEIVPGTPGVT